MQKGLLRQPFLFFMFFQSLKQPVVAAFSIIYRALAHPRLCRSNYHLALAKHRFCYKKLRKSKKKRRNVVKNLRIWKKSSNFAARTLLHNVK